MDGTNVSGPFKKLMQLSFWVFFSNNFVSWSDMFRDSLVQLGLSAGQGGNYKISFDPSSIGGLAMDVTSPIVQSMHDAGVMHPGDAAERSDHADPAHVVERRRRTGRTVLIGL
jgi:hypothetical protein